SDSERHSFLVLPWAERSWEWWPWSPLAAYAQERPADEIAIAQLLDRYAEAGRSKSIDELATIQPDMGQEQRSALIRYFQNADELAVRISDVDVVVAGDEALATFTREDIFKDELSGKRIRLEVRITGTFAKRDGSWRIKGLRKPS